tara:strand:- start:1097 stop:1249 length:153 start_codon:yes stop_codon:yes gene_type:complete
MESSDYESWSVKEFLEHELKGVRELYMETKDPMLPHVIEYLERRLKGKIG